jgi:hypothetical protein
LEKCGTHGAPNGVLPDAVIEVFKTHKTGTVPGKTVTNGIPAAVSKLEKETCTYKQQKQICTLLGYYTSLSGSFLPTFRDNLSVPSSRFKNSKKKSIFLDFLALEDGTVRLSRNVATELPVNVA